MSKIEISKAIHNGLIFTALLVSVVVSVSKIEISKAIHNLDMFTDVDFIVVVSVSKIEISKAIHNGCISVELLSTQQKYFCDAACEKNK